LLVRVVEDHTYFKKTGCFENREANKRYLQSMDIGERSDGTTVIGAARYG